MAKGKSKKTKKSKAQQALEKEYNREYNRIMSTLRKAKKEGFTHLPAAPKKPKKIRKESVESLKKKDIGWLNKRITKVVDGQEYSRENIKNIRKLRPKKLHYTEVDRRKYLEPVYYADGGLVGYKDKVTGYYYQPNEAKTDEFIKVKELDISQFNDGGIIEIPDDDTALDDAMIILQEFESRWLTWTVDWRARMDSKTNIADIFNIWFNPVVESGNREAIIAFAKQLELNANALDEAVGYIVFNSDDDTVALGVTTIYKIMNNIYDNIASIPGGSQIIPNDASNNLADILARTMEDENPFKLR